MTPVQLAGLAMVKTPSFPVDAITTLPAVRRAEIADWNAGEQGTSVPKLSVMIFAMCAFAGTETSPIGNPAAHFMPSMMSAV
ncbi:MAG TPA: hypothetical protein PLD78_03025 [Burkholderiaceae bacterium]|nr:hypothetical protein [Burkholderiaceae bacterium]